MGEDTKPRKTNGNTARGKSRAPFSNLHAMAHTTAAIDSQIRPYQPSTAPRLRCSQWARCSKNTPTAQNWLAQMIWA